MSPKRSKKSTKKSIEDKRDNTRVPLDDQLWQNLCDKLKQRYKSETQLNIAYIQGDWYNLVESGKIRREEPPNQQTLQNFLKEDPKPRTYWLIDGLCQLLLGYSFEDWQNSRSPRSHNQQNQSHSQNTATEQDRHDWQPAEATEAEATPAANSENSITPTTPNTPIMGRLSVVPKIPENLLPRDEEIAAVKKLLLSDRQQPVAIAGQSRQVGIQGMGGIGKSTLAAIVAHDEEVRRRFPDGIFWQPLGQNPSLRLRQLDLCKILGDPEPQFEDVQGGKVHLRELLKNKTCLLILDDVWHVDDADAFNVLSSSSQLLLTTRNLEPIQGLNAQEFQLSILTDPQAQAMLASYAGQHPENLPTITHEIARECGNLPLALAMIGAQMRGKPENRWDNLLHKLRNADLEKIRFDFVDYPYPDLFKAIQVSVEELTGEEQKRYLDFAVFPEDTPIPEAVLQTFWQPEGLHQYDTQDIIDTLVNLSLAQRDHQERLTLHDLQYDYVRKQAGDLSGLHQRLLNAYAAKCENGWHTGPNDGYFFEHLANHLLAAGKKSELRQLLFNFQWLEAKLNATDVNALIADYELLSDDQDLRLIQEAIQLSAYTLRFNSGKNQLASQLIGRLLSFDSPPIQAFLKQAKPSADIPWIRPLTSSLIPPGGPLLRTLIGHKNQVSAVAITPDGKYIVSGSGDQTIKIWDLATGKEVKTLTGYNGWLSKLAITPDGKYMVSSAEDNTIKIWNLSTGKIVRTLTGHEDRVYGMAIAPDGKKVVSSSGDNSVRCWNLENGEELWKTKESVRSTFLAMHDNQTVMFHAMQDIKILDLQTGKVIRTIKGYNSDNFSVCKIEPNPNCNYIVYGLRDDTLKVVDVITGEEKATLKGHKSTLNMVVAITPDCRRIISGASNDQMIKIWDLETGEELQTLTRNNRDISAIAITPDQKFLVTGSRDNTIKIWDLHSTEEEPKFPGHDDAVSAVAISPDGRLAFSGSQDGTLKIWDLAERKEIKTIQTNYPIFDFSISADTELAFLNTEEEWEEILKFCEIKNGQEKQLFDDWFGNLRAVSVTGRLAISDAWDENQDSESRLIKVWDLKEKQMLWQLPVERSFEVAAISANEKFAITASCNGTVIIWDLCNQQELWNFSEIHEELEVVAISATGKIAASASNIWGNSLIIRNLITGKTLHNDDYIEVPMGISTLVISADEQLLIASGDSMFTIWKLDPLEVITTFHTEGNLPACAIAPDNRTIIVGEESGRLHFLRLEGL